MKFRSSLRGIMPLMLTVTLLVTFASCGNDDDNDSSNDTQPEEQVDSGLFQAVLSPQNAPLSAATGSSQVRIIGDDLNAMVALTGAKEGAHIQHVHVGTRCPTLDDDTNGDGYVDATEAAAVYGAPLLTLDSNLESASAETFPSGANYSYEENASLARILSSLNIATLGLEGRVVNVHGVPESTNLPATVQGGKANFPISCGTLKKIADEGVTAASAASSDVASAAAGAASAATSAATAVSSATSAAASVTGGSH